MANYLAGVAYYHMAQYKDAIKHLEAFSPKNDNGVSPMALYALANCYACDKQIDKAIETFKKAADKALCVSSKQANCLRTLAKRQKQTPFMSRSKKNIRSLASTSRE